MKTYLPPTKPKMTCFYHKDFPKGKSFLIDEVEEKFEKMVSDGWVDSPAKLNLPKDDSLDITEDQVSSLNPDDLVKLVESLGFKVFTPEMLKAEIEKFSTASVNLEDCNSEAMIAELEKRGAITVSGKQEEVSDSGAVILDKMQEVFNVNPKQLNKDELVRLGKERYGLHLMVSWKEDTLITKIKEAMAG